MTASARETILHSIRNALSGPDGGGDAVVPDRWPKGAWTRPRSGHDPVAEFTAKAELNLCTVERIDAEADVVPAVERVVIAAELTARVATAGVSITCALRDYPWPQSWAVITGTGRPTEVVAVTDALAGISETGSLVLCSDADHPSSLNFVPELHICILRAPDIVRHLDDVWPKLRQLQVWPRAVNIVSGPSRTADVAQVVVRPAHGPKSLHIILVGEL